MTSRKPPPPPPNRRAKDAPENLPDPPAWAGAGVPEAVHDDPTKVDGYRITIPVHDERAFMQECADRLNAFIHTYPDEAQHVLNAFVEYEHELVPIYEAAARHKIHKSPRPPGVSVAVLICALLQTHRAPAGFVLRPLVLPDPDRGVGCTRIVKFTVEEQEDLDDEPRV